MCILKKKLAKVYIVVVLFFVEQFGKGEWAGKGWWCSKKAGAHPRMVLQKGESTAALVFFPDTQLCAEGGGAAARLNECGIKMQAVHKTV